MTFTNRTHANEQNHKHPSQSTAPLQHSVEKEYNERRQHYSMDKWWCVLSSDAAFFFLLGGLDQIVHVNVEIVVVFDVVDGGLCGDLVDDQPGSLHSFVSNIFDLLTHKALCLLTRLPVSRQQVLVLWNITKWGNMSTFFF